MKIIDHFILPLHDIETLNLAAIGRNTTDTRPFDKAKNLQTIH